jgi:ribulose 1,5-bisphosphate synthetase/thiazole synthase
MKFNTSNFLCYGMIVQALLPFRVRAFSPPISRADRATRVFSQGRDYSVGIVGGGLAGLATAFHLIERNPEVCITIIDKASPGTGGASSVAGG